MPRYFYGVMILLLLHASCVFGQAIPGKMTYCGIELTVTPGAQARLGEMVTQLQASPRYFNEMVRRAQIYMPFIEEALEHVRVPADLRYLAIVESSLRADAVSSSGAVGFWQFKQPTALELGLRVNEEVDERMHIYRSSEAAARYLAKVNLDFDNWIYAIIAYNQGPTGAVPFTDPRYYGNEKMVVDENLHPYALKALAYKIAYEPALSSRSRPEIFLMPYSNGGEELIKALAERHELDEASFLEYNRWVLNPRRLPKNESFTYYISQSGDLYTGHTPDPGKTFGGQPAVYTPPAVAVSQPEEAPAPPAEVIPQPTERSDETPAPPAAPLTYVKTPEAVEASEVGRGDYVEFVFERDLDYGSAYIWYEGTESMTSIADRYGIRLTDLLKWNGLVPGEEPQPETVIYLQSPTRQLYHIVRKGESISYIAALRATRIKSLQKKNGMNKRDLILYIGQKLY
ncbi:MAG: LysM peptidoglycan-binding domain-containing protein, partial [Bacteroidetes bacterium]